VIDEAFSIQVGEPVQKMLSEQPMPWQKGVIPFGKPWDSEIILFFQSIVFKDIIDHGKSNLSREVMGILLGQIFTCPLSKKVHVIIDAAIPSRLAVGTGTKVVFDHDSWAEVLMKKERDYPLLQIVGWYHTHPAMGAFFSAADNFCHKLAFSNPWQIGITYDPTGNSGAIFGWDMNNVTLIDGFYELLDTGFMFSKIANMGINWDFKNILLRKQPTREKGRALPTNADGNDRKNIIPLSVSRRSISELTRQGARYMPKELDPIGLPEAVPQNEIIKLKVKKWILISLLFLILIAMSILVYYLIENPPQFK